MKASMKNGKKVYTLGGSYSEITPTDNKKKNMSIIPQDTKKNNVISKEKLNKFVNFKFK